MIKVRTPREIDGYKEKFMFGMSIRQLTGAVVAGILGIGSYILCIKVLGFSADFASYAVIFLSAPPLALGFVKIKGMYFEDFARLFYEYRGTDGRKILIYEYQADLSQDKTEKMKAGKKRKKKKEDLNEAIFKGPDFSKKAIKQAWREAKQYIKEA